MENKTYFKRILEYLKENKSTLQEKASKVKWEFLNEQGVTNEEELEEWENDNEDGLEIWEDCYILVEGALKNGGGDSFGVWNRFWNYTQLIHAMEKEGEGIFSYMEKGDKVELEKYTALKVYIYYEYCKDCNAEILATLTLNKQTNSVMETKKNYGEKIVALLKQHFMDIEFCVTEGDYYAVDLGEDACRDLINPDDYGLDEYEGMHLCFWNEGCEGKNNYGGGIHVTLKIYPHGNDYSFCDETEEMQSEIYRLFCKECGVEPDVDDEAEEEKEEPQQPSTFIGYSWDAKCDDGCFEDHGKVFPTQEEAYNNMRDAVLEKMKWNTEWEDVVGEDGLLSYEVYFNQDTIVHESYSGKYTYTIKEVHRINISTADVDEFNCNTLDKHFNWMMDGEENGMLSVKIESPINEVKQLKEYISTIVKSPSERLQEQIDNGTPIVFFFDCDRECFDDDEESTMIDEMTLEQCLKCAIDYCTLPEYEDAFRWIGDEETPKTDKDGVYDITDEYGNDITKCKSGEELQKFYAVRMMILHRHYIRIIFK